MKLPNAKYTNVVCTGFFNTTTTIDNISLLLVYFRGFISIWWSPQTMSNLKTLHFTKRQSQPKKQGIIQSVNKAKVNCIPVIWITYKIIKEKHLSLRIFYLSFSLCCLKKAYRSFSFCISISFAHKMLLVFADSVRLLSRWKFTPEATFLVLKFILKLKKITQHLQRPSFLVCILLAKDGLILVLQNAHSLKCFLAFSLYRKNNYCVTEPLLYIGFTLHNVTALRFA